MVINLPHSVHYKVTRHAYALICHMGNQRIGKWPNCLGAVQIMNTQSLIMSDRTAPRARLASFALLCLGLALGAFIGYESLLPGSGLPPTQHSDKIVHFAAYFALALLLCSALSARRRFAVCAAVIGYGGLIEILQSAMALGRTGSWLDMAANIAGAIFGLFLANTLSNFITARRIKRASHYAE